MHVCQRSARAERATSLSDVKEWLWAWKGGEEVGEQGGEGCVCQAVVWRLSGCPSPAARSSLLPRPHRSSCSCQGWPSPHSDCFALPQEALWSLWLSQCLRKDKRQEEQEKAGQQAFTCKPWVRLASVIRKHLWASILCFLSQAAAAAHKMPPWQGEGNNCSIHTPWVEPLWSCWAPNPLRDSAQTWLHRETRVLLNPLTCQR